MRLTHTYACSTALLGSENEVVYKMPGAENARADEQTEWRLTCGSLAGLDAWREEARNLVLASDRMLAIARRNRNARGHSRLLHPAVTAHHNALMAQYIGRILADTYYDSDVMEVIPDSIPPLPAPTPTSMGLPYPPPDTELGLTASTSIDELPPLPITVPLEDTQLAPPFAHPNVEAINKMNTAILRSLST